MATQEELEEGIMEVVTDGYPNYDRYTYAINNSITFRGKSLSEWQEEIQIPRIEESMSIDELERFNRHFLGMTQIIMENLAYARTAYDGAKMHYVSSINTAKEAILQERSIAGARPPGAEVLEGMAKTRVNDVFMAYNISELFYEFWKVCYDKLKFMDSRLTSMNFLKRYGD